MGTYCSQADVDSYIEGEISLDPFALERFIQRAERDIDLIVGDARQENPPTQVISLGAAGNLPTAGDYTLTFDGQTTTPLAWDSTAIQVETALQELTNVGLDSNSVSNAQVLGNNPFTIIWSLPWVRDNYFGRRAPVVVSGENVYPVNYEIPLIVVNASSLTPPIASVKEVLGRKINPLTDLDRNQVLGLSNATCAQVEYRWQMGENFFVRPQYSSVKGPDFATAGKLPMIAPKARRELAQYGLILLGGRVFAGRGRRGVAKGWPTY